MTVNNTTSQAELAYGNGIATAFPFAFEAMAPEQVGVMVNGVVTPNSHTVTLNAGGAGGTVTFASPPASGAEVLSFSYPSFLQQVSFTNAGKFLPETHDAVADLGSIRDIYLLGRIGEALRGPPGSPIPALPPGDGVVVIEDGVPTLVPEDEFAQGAPGTPGGNVMAIGLFTAAAGLTIAVGTDIVQTSGYSVAGKGHAIYLADAVVDAAYVTANPREAFRTVNGRGFRISMQQQVNVLMFGAVANNVADDLPAFEAMLKAVKNQAVTTGDETNIYYRAVPPCHVPAGLYYLSNTLELQDASYHLIGAGFAAQNGGNPTVLRFAAGVTGIRVHSIDTLGEDSKPAGISAIGSQIENIKLNTDGAAGSTTADGFRIRAMTFLINCS
ncbi:MAG: hypothetical protein EHM67_06790, partial [Hyphomicrobiaceae bacterium]